MPIYKAPVEDVNFLLNDVFQIDRYDNLPGFSRCLRRRARGDPRRGRQALPKRCCSRSTASATSKAARAHDDGSVTTPKGFKEAFKQVAEGGWLGLSAPTEYRRPGPAGDARRQVVNEFQMLRQHGVRRCIPA